MYAYGWFPKPQNVFRYLFKIFFPNFIAGFWREDLLSKNSAMLEVLSQKIIFERRNKWTTKNAAIVVPPLKQKLRRGIPRSSFLLYIKPPYDLNLYLCLLTPLLICGPRNWMQFCRHVSLIQAVIIYLWRTDFLRIFLRIVNSQHWRLIFSMDFV